MELVITVTDETRSALEQRAHEHGYSDVSKYVERLISSDLLAARSFDEILAPVRQTFQKGGISDDELQTLFEEEREEVQQERKAQER
jgi:rubrerythrin